MFISMEQIIINLTEQSPELSIICGTVIIVAFIWAFVKLANWNGN